MALAIPQDEAIDKANALLDALDTSCAVQARLIAEQDEEIKAAIKQIMAKRTPQIDALSEAIETYEAGLADLWSQHASTLTGGKGKTANLRSGKISERLGSKALVVPDMKALRRYLLKLGQLRRHGKFVGWTVDKSKVKANEDLVANAPDDLMWYERKRTLYFKTPKLEAEKARELTPLKMLLDRPQG